MGLLSRILHRDKPSSSDDNQILGSMANTQIATRRNNSAQEAEDRQNKGIDIDMIDPQEIVEELTYLAHYEYTAPVRTLITGNNGISQLVVVDEKRVGTRAWAVAILGYMNKVWPTIWMAPYEADTLKLNLRTAFHDIRKNMTYEEKKKYGIVLRMARDLCLARCEDMKEGHKGLLIKVRREDLHVGMSKGNERVGGR